MTGLMIDRNADILPSFIIMDQERSDMEICFQELTICLT